MDLLNGKNAMRSNKQYQKLMKAIEELPIERVDVQRAEDFLDFSKEMDLSLLDGAKLYDLSDITSYNMYQVISELCSDEEKDYFDRVILYLDAIGGNTIGNYIDYGHIEGTYIRNAKFAYRLQHAYARKYDSRQVKLKIMALIAQCEPANLISQYLARNKDNIRLMYEAADYCNAKWANAKVKLYVHALAYMKPQDKQNLLDKAKSFVTGNLDEDTVRKMIDYLLETAEENRSDNNVMMQFIMPALFMAIHHDERIENLIKSYIQGRETEFLEVLYTNIPYSYFEHNTDKIFALAIDGQSEEFVTDCIKQAVAFSWKDDRKSTQAECMLYAFAKRYPKQFIYVMTLMETINYNSPIYRLRTDYYCSFYEQMYHILKKANPNVIADEKIDFYEGILHFVITEELEKTKIAKEEIKAYLTGEEDLSVLERYFDSLSYNYQIGGYYSRYTSISRNIETCIKNIEGFRRRYLALKAIQCPALVPSISYHFYKDRDEGIVDELIKAKVPIVYRFRSYEEIYNNLWDKQKQKFEDFVVSRMEHFRFDGYDICMNGGVFARKVYVRYLEKTGKTDMLFGMFGDSSKEVRKAVVSVMANHKEYEKEILECLQSKKLAVRETAVDILSAFGAENYRDTLVQMLDTEKSKKLVEKIQTILSVNVSGNGGKSVSVSSIVADVHKGGRSRQLSWLYDKANFTEVHFTDGGVADEKYIQAIMLSYVSMGQLGINENAKLLADGLNKDELQKLALEVFNQWVSQGAEAKKKWVLYFSLIHGGYDMQESILHYIKEWAENARGAIASEAVRALAMNGSSTALMAVDNMAHTFKKRQIKNAAMEAMEKAAEELGITTEELGDRIVPDLGFDGNMERVFDYGARKFKVYLTTALEIEVFDENGKKLKSMPAPAKKDDETIAKKSNTEFKQMKKQLKSVITIQKTRMETALLADRRWNVRAWKELFVKNPVMHSFAMGLVWSAYMDNQLVQTFRYMEDGTFNTSDEDEYELPENAVIGLVHPIDIDIETLSAWKEQLSDYEIVQPIEQLERQVYRVKDGEIGKKTLLRYKGVTMNDLTLLGRMTKFGWQKGTVLDAGCFSTFYREDITERVKNADGTVTLKGNAVVVNFSGMYVSGTGEDVDISEIRFYSPESAKKEIDDDVQEKYALKLDTVNERYFSEIINQLETILKVSE